MLVANSQSQSCDRKSDCISIHEQCINVSVEYQGRSIERCVVAYRNWINWPNPCCIGRVACVHQLVVDWLYRFNWVQIIVVKEDVNLVPQLAQRTIRCANNRLRYYRLNGGPEIQIKSDALIDPVVECQSIDVTKSKWSSAENINQIRVVRKRLCESDNHFAIGVAKANIGRSDRYVVPCKKIQLKRRGKVTANTNK